MKRLVNCVYCALLYALAVFLPQSVVAEEITKTWAVAEFGEPLYKDGIEHLSLIHI